MSRGILARISQGVYRATATPVTFESALWHAVLATGGVLVASTAAWLWELIAETGYPITVAVAHGRTVTAPPGVRVIRSDRLVQRATHRHGLPVSTRRSAAVEHLVSLSRLEATRFADRAIQCRWITSKDLEDRLGARLPGNSVVRQVLRTIVAGAEAESERQLQRLLHAADIAGWRANRPIRTAGGRVVRPDILFEEARLVIEADGFAYHSKGDRYQRDRTKQNALTLTGYTVLRFTWEDIHERPDFVMDQILAALELAA